jgi:hypothetical protein
MGKKRKKVVPVAKAGTAAGTPNAARVSSPASAGGAGTFFEQHVDAYWLAQLLVGGIAPILHDCAVVEVHLQTEHFGWHTDDFLIVGQNGSRHRRKLIGQVKRTFTVSAADDECKKTVQDFWKDFRNSGQFSPAADRLALVTLRGTNTLLEHFSGLLDCSRAARDGAEFERRLATPGFISDKAVQYCDELQTIISETEGRRVSAAEIWSFLRVLHILSLDLNSSTRQTEAMIGTLLAHTTSEPDAVAAAQASWDALLRQVGEGMPAARSFRRGDLPETLRKRHAPMGGGDQQALRALSDHSGLILGGIRSTIGTSLHLGRGHMVQQVIERLESAPVVLIAGSAGGGKSCLAKDVVGVLGADHFVFSFRAEEFAHPHLDETLQSSQIPVNAATLAAILAGQGRKLVLVESMERLLEKSTRDAFTDLLTLAAQDESWRLVLTCRDYSTDLVRSGLLEPSKVGHSVVVVPPLEDGELEEVEAAYPTLARPLANATLRRILRNPYVLDKALQIRWSDEQTLPQSEREFRTLFWQEIVRADHRTADGMPRRREETFVEIALRRARALTLYARCGDLDPQVVDALRHDSLIAVSEKSNVLVAPAHDVLEDWAILYWMEEQYLTHDGSVQALATAIGTHPAVRRTYRKWVTELVERDPVAADGLFQAAIRERLLPAQFRDDTLVSLLHAPAVASFLGRHSAELFANEKQLLLRVIHLLRVACVTTPAWLETSVEHASLFNVPDGPAWPCVLGLVQTHLPSFEPGDRLLLLGFIEDWARGVSWRAPYPDGAEAAAAIAHRLLPDVDDYRSTEQRKRTLQVIAKIPNGDPARFAALLRGRREGSGRDRATDDFRELIFEGLEGMPAARDMPDLLVSVADNYLLCSEVDLQGEWSYGGSLELEPLFGIRQGLSHDFFPASAYRGPFLPLLRHNPRQGLRFIIGVFNHSADWYAHPRVASEYVRIEPPLEITLTFEDGTSRKQWCNARLWNMYRGTSVGPYLVQSLLMALERWLLELGEARQGDLDGLLLRLLHQSSSAAVTAVVASVATAFPHAAGRTLLVLLRTPACIRLDRQRLMSESQALSRLSDVMPQLDARNAVYEDERRESDALGHRRHDLEMAITNLQLGPLAPRVHEILDRHRAEMPPVDEQDEDDRVWRLALHRMDLRQYRAAGATPDVSGGSKDGTPPEDHQRSIRLELQVPEPDIREMVEESTARFGALNSRLSLVMWGLKVFGYEEDAAYQPGQWREKLQQARSANNIYDGGEEQDLGQGGPGLVAAVCVRDHWNEMSADERAWCLEIVCSEVERDGDRWDQLARVGQNSMSADRPCASVLSVLLGGPLDGASRSRVDRAFVVALTHPSNEVRWYTVSGIGRHLWGTDRALALRCVNALATEATLVQQAADAATRRSSARRRQIEEIEAEAAAVIRRGFFETNGIPDDAHETLDASRWFGAEANRYALAILVQAPSEHVAIAAFERLAHTLVGWWDADDERHSSRDTRRHERNHQTEAALSNLLERFLLRTSMPAAARTVQPILDVVDRHPRAISWLLQGLIGLEDREPNTPQFWSLWKLFAGAVRRARWLARIDEEHPTGGEVMSAIFLGTWWKKGVRHWRSLEGHGGHVHALFEILPASSRVLDDYLRFLYHVGEQSLPQAFIRIARRLQAGAPSQMIRLRDTVFMLEVLLQRYVYGRPLELKRHSELRESVLFLLDTLVENGSSAAFRMRDDFVTPTSPS